MHWRSRPILLAVALVLALGGMAQAEGLEAYAIGGYATLSMEKVNKFIDDMNASGKLVEAFGGTYEPLEKFTRAFWGEGGLRYSVTPTLFVGAGVRYMAPNGSDGKVSGKNPYDPSVTYTSDVKMSVSVWGPTFTVGTPFALPGMPVTVTLAGTIGYYMLTFREDSSYDEEPGTVNDATMSLTAGASGLGYGLRGAVTYSLSPQLTLEGAVGYERLYYEKVTVQSASATNAVAPKTGDPITDMNGDPLPFDLSGIRATVGLSYSF